MNSPNVSSLTVTAAAAAARPQSYTQSFCVNVAGSSTITVENDVTDSFGADLYSISAGFFVVH